MKPKITGVRKRTQIAIANRNMFMWVAGISVILGFCVVGIIFLTQMLLFNEKVLAEKNRTISVLNGNIAAAEELTKKINVLDTNQDLIDKKANIDDKTLQPIFDALPSAVNSSALGSSVQVNLVSSVPGVSLDAIQVDPVVGVETVDDGSYVDESADNSGSNTINFRFTASADNTNIDALKKVLMNLENSIRTIDITMLKLENQESKLSMTIQARGFYELERKVVLKEKLVKS